MLTQTFGRLRQEADERRGVRFERIYDYRPDELWSALIEPEQIRGWLGEAELDLREGGGGTLRLDDEMTATLSIRRLEPGRLVEYDWNFPDEPPSILRFELEPREKGTLLVLDHRRLAADDAPGYGAGWHSHLDALELMLAGQSHDWDDRFKQLHPGYEEQAGELRADPQLGALRSEGDRRAVRYERVLPASPEDVWHALTEPEALRVWMDAEAVVEPEVGGRFELRLSYREVMDGRVRVWDPPRTLEFTWDEGEDNGFVRWELSPAAEGTRLVLDHAALPERLASSIGAGWHSHLEWLEAHLSASSHEFWQRYRELLPLYEDAAAAI